jgi:NADPH oxidase
MTALGPNAASFFGLDRCNERGEILPGKIQGPDGQPLFDIDGPHSAPTQHVGEYTTVMVIGGGIGVTPVASTLKSVVYHRWKKSVGSKCYPTNAYFYWVISHRDIDSFRWLVRVIKDACDEVCHLRATVPEEMAGKGFGFFIWVTSVPKDAQAPRVVVEDDLGFWGLPYNDPGVHKRGMRFDESDIYRAMKCPADEPIRLGDVVIRKGRPKWGPEFQSVAEKVPEGDIGVTFCGNPFIAADLGKNCYLHSIGRNGGDMFTFSLSLTHVYIMYKMYVCIII